MIRFGSSPRASASASARFQIQRAPSAARMISFASAAPRRLQLGDKDFEGRISIAQVPSYSRGISPTLRPFLSIT